MSFIERGLVAGRAPWFYFSKLVWPSNLIFIYQRWEIDPWVWWQWLFPLATATTLLVLWKVRSRWRAPLAGVLFFTGTLFPALGFFNVYPFIFSFVADHFQYLASLGIIVLLAAGITLALTHCLPERPGTRPGICFAILILLAMLTSRPATMYGNIATLYETTIARNPECWLAHLNLGTVLMNSGQPVPALRHFEEAYALRPQHGDIRSNLGIALFQVGRQAEGLEHL
jgi:tetratricopeptide (TPR) repeat protein